MAEERPTTDFTALLPDAFVRRMRALLGPEAEELFRALHRWPARGIRFNTLKVPRGEIGHRAQRLPFGLTPVPWCPEGFVVPPGVRPGLHPYHALGVYYIQDPSAMLPVVLLDPRPGERVLDLAAAPGGKSTHIAARLERQGLLVANDAKRERAHVLVQNLTLFGAPNVLVTVEQPRRLARRWPERFDAVLVDAPCSGEGLFRREPEARAYWSEGRILREQKLQLELLEAAARLVRPGGRIVYSTCTFAPEEDEEVVARFLEAHPEFALAPPSFAERERLGLRGSEAFPPLSPEDAVRLWPHRVEGDGHFVARFTKLGKEGFAGEDGWAGRTPTFRKTADAKGDLRARRRAAELFQNFLAEVGADAWETLRTAPSERLYLRGEEMFLLPDLWSDAETFLRDVAGMRVLLPGLFLGRVRRDRFLPEHALAAALPQNLLGRVRAIRVDEGKLVRYFRGEEIALEGEKDGYALLSYEDFPAGWVRLRSGTGKNLFPKSLRRDLSAAHDAFPPEG
ncbi:MAG: RsmF rRNA methyltransferase first C-terminal domain-containing protein [Brockia lithotrophica]|nr:RsmF rRNA methyltransferase first C-terminal domain-containing protein [Brockia lithotrophica]